MIASAVFWSPVAILALLLRYLVGSEWVEGHRITSKAGSLPRVHSWLRCDLWLTQVCGQRCQQFIHQCHLHGQTNSPMVADSTNMFCITLSATARGTQRRRHLISLVKCLGLRPTRFTVEFIDIMHKDYIMLLLIAGTCNGIVDRASSLTLVCDLENILIHSHDAR